MEYIYTAIFGKNDDGSFTITFPQLPGCISEGRGLSEAMDMAAKALTQWVVYLLDIGEELPAPVDPTEFVCAHGTFAAPVKTNVKDQKAVRRTVSLPRWMDVEPGERESACRAPCKTPCGACCNGGRQDSPRGPWRNSV